MVKIRSVLAALLVSAPLLLLLGQTLSRPLPDVVVHGDLALIELSTLRATRFEQLEGPYSRFKMHHPGPALFYWLAPFYALGGQRYGALCLGMVVLNGAAFACLLLIPWRLLGERGLSLAAPASTLLFLHAGPAMCWSVWNPDAGVLPLAASAACAFAVAAGRPNFLPAGIFFGSFAAQCHVLYLAPVAATWLAALAVTFWRSRAAGSRAARTRTAWMAAAVIGTVMWFPVALEQWRGDPGNLSRIFYLKGATEERAVGAAAALAAGGAAIAEPLFSPFGYGGLRRVEGEQLPLARALAGLLAILAVAVGALAIRRGSTLALPALLCLAALLGSSWWALAAISGKLHDHLTRFLVPTLPLAILLLGCALASGSARPPAARCAGAAGLAVAAVLSLLGCREILRMPPLGEFLDRIWGVGRWGEAVPKILAGLEKENIVSPYVGLVDSGYWYFATAIADQVEKRGGHALVFEDWEFMFGREHARGAHDGLLLLDFIESEASKETPDPPPPARVVAESPLEATLIPLPGPFERGGRNCIQAGDDDAELFLRSGFYPAELHPSEPPSRWSRLDVSRLSLRLVPGRDYVLSFEASPFEAALPQEVAVSFNGRKLAGIAMESGWQRYRVAIPAGLVAPVNEVELRYSKAVVPREISDSKDHRSLALRYRSICFEESANAGVAARFVGLGLSKRPPEPS